MRPWVEVDGVVGVVGVDGVLDTRWPTGLCAAALVLAGALTGGVPAQAVSTAGAVVTAPAAAVAGSVAAHPVRWAALAAHSDPPRDRALVGRGLRARSARPVTRPVPDGAAAAAPTTPASTPPPTTTGPSVPVNSTNPLPQEAVPLGDLPGWRQVFADDFTTPVPTGSFPGAVYGARWGGYDGLTDTSGRGTYSPSKVLSVADGALTYRMRTEDGTPLVAAPVPKLPGYGQTYGRYSVRFRTNQAAGYKMAFLLWPDSEDWDDGELDWPEVGELGERPSPASLITGTPSSGGARFLPTVRTFAPTGTSDWHVATTDWTPGKVVFSWDGVPVATVTRDVPSTSMHWVLQAETAIGTPPPAPSTVGRIDVDWAVAYRYEP